MKLGTLHADRVLLKYFDLDSDYTILNLDYSEDFPEIDALYIDWVIDDRVVHQAAVVDHYAKKKIPVVIFDRYLRMTNKEYNWLKKFKTYFFEPAINHRRKFRYLPVWTETYDLDTFPDVDLDRTIDLSCYDYIGNKLKAFEKYYVEFGRLYPKWSIYYSEYDKITQEKRDEYEESNVKPGSFSYPQAKCFILIGTERAYEIGYLYPYVFDVMTHGCLPLLPQEHRYFHCLFSDNIIEKVGDINYIMSGYNVLCIPSIVDVYKRVEKYYPEMKVDYAVDVIKKCLEG